MIALPLVYWYHFSTNKYLKSLIVFLNLPILLPPTVLGFYLLVIFEKISLLGVHLLFTFEGLLVASVIYNLPFMLNPLILGLQSLPSTFQNASFMLGLSPRQTFFSVLIPNIRSSIVAALLLTFAHTMGEFGVVLMIGGNIPKVTELASIALFNHVEALRYEQAHIYALIMIALSVIVLYSLYFFNSKNRHVKL
jgi:molybdate transport system permease protein